PDGRTRAVQLRTKNGEIERPVQHLYPLELQCDTKGNANEPKRAAAADARAKITAIAEDQEEDM
ncbi:Hypothetical predicted protein, partial [Paramuricea clavata]